MALPRTHSGNDVERTTHIEPGSERAPSLIHPFSFCSKNGFQIETEGLARGLLSSVDMKTIGAWLGNLGLVTTLVGCSSSTQSPAEDEAEAEGAASKGTMTCQYTPKRADQFDPLAFDFVVSPPRRNSAASRAVWVWNQVSEVGLGEQTLARDGSGKDRWDPTRTNDWSSEDELRVTLNAGQLKTGINKIKYARGNGGDTTVEVDCQPTKGVLLQCSHDSDTTAGIENSMFLFGAGLAFKREKASNAYWSRTHNLDLTVKFGFGGSYADVDGEMWQCQMFH